LTFAAGVTSRIFSVLVADDVYVEANETVNIMLSNAAGGPVLGIEYRTLTINDNDSTTPTSNPADVAQFFVRQHYSDFLDRDPDAPG